MMKKTKLLLGLPKGSLWMHTMKVVQNAGFHLTTSSERNLKPTIDDEDIECFLLRPQEIPAYVAAGKLNMGITGDDWIAESKKKVIKVDDLKYAKEKTLPVRWVLAVAKQSPIKTVKDLKGKTIATELVELTKKYLRKHGVAARVVFSWGSTEVKPPHFCDAIVDLTETGTSLRAHSLRVIDTVFESSTKLIANEKSWGDKWKRKKIKEFALVIRGAAEGEEAALLYTHIPAAKVDQILPLLPSFKAPTVQKIAGTEWYTVRIGARGKKTIRTIIPNLKRIGCTDILEIPTNAYTK